MNSVAGLCVLFLGLFPIQSTGSYGFDNPIVRGKPFSAEYRITRTWTSPEGRPWVKVTRGSLYRDSQGRVRDEFSEDAWPFSAFPTVEISDPVSDTTAMLLMGKVLFKTKLSDSGPPQLVSTDSRRFFQLPSFEDIRRVRPIGQQVIDGQACDGYRIDEPGDHQTEYWVSSELDQIVYEKVVAKGTEQVFELLEIKRGEPDHGLFVIPAGSASPTSKQQH